jgi:hypothetical protein
MTQETIDPIKELKQLVGEIERKEGLQPDEAFVLWFVRSHLTENEEHSRASLTRRGHEKGVDAIHIDHGARQVSIVQGKYRTKGIGKPESRGEVLQLAQYGRLMTQDGDSLSRLAETADVTVRDKLKEALRVVRDKEYGLNLYFVTTGSISPRLISDAEDAARHDGRVRFIPFHGRDIQKVIADYVFDAAPAVPTLELAIEGGMLERHDEENGIDAYVFTMNGKNVGELLKAAGRRLFARNIRGFMGKGSDVNRSIAETLKKEPHNFWYFNNGVTIICDEATECGTAGRKRLRVKNPQVINGQQTSHVLRLHGSKDAELLMRVIAIPRQERKDFGRFNDLVGEIVAATNWQNKIVPSDLKANDPEQIRVERELRKRGYLYVRKRMAKGEARALAVTKPRFTLKKEELAQAVAAVDLDPYYIRLGKETLFEADIYPKLFWSGRDISEYLAAYWLNVVCRYQARGNILRRQGRWLAAHFLWEQLSDALRTRAFRHKFIFASERYWQHATALNPLYQAAGGVFRALRHFYLKNRRSPEGFLDEGTFFKYRNRAPQFERFFRARGGLRQTQRQLRRFVSRIDQLDP